MKYKLNCIKCSNKYSTSDPDPYYCSTCNKERLVIAKEVDKKMSMRPSKRKHMSGLDQYDAINKGGFVNAKDLGI
jgi:hypothetical protein